MSIECNILVRSRGAPGGERRILASGIEDLKAGETGRFVEPLRKEDKAKERPIVEINRGLCKGCGICVAFCPKKVLELDESEKAVPVRPEDCNACGLCELRCPDIAVELVRGRSAASEQK